MATFSKIEETMGLQGSTPEQISLFKSLFLKFKEQKGTALDWSSISSPPEDAILDYDTLSGVDETASKELLSQLAVCKLNGGLGTSMGCVGPKSALEVRNGKSFLDLIVTQIHKMNEKFSSDVPLVLMNSFNTDQDTRKIINKYDNLVTIKTFQQNDFPRLRTDSLLPMVKEVHGHAASYPPGHGDFYISLKQSGVLDELIKAGKRYMFVSNADNLGASVDLKILKVMKDKNAPFIMEVTPKTRADVKGGTLVETSKNKLELLEIAQVPKLYKEEFKSVKKFKIFNTNNVWVDLIELKKKLDSNTLELDVIVNKKTVNHIPVIQLETAIGGGINSFENSLAVSVPRVRFLPIKKTNDLLLVQSNLFIEKDGVLVKNPERQFEGLPLIRLGKHFENIEEYQKRFENIPDILELDLLTIVGDVYFNRDITLRGHVILMCEQGELNLPEQSVIENKVLTGSIKMAEL